MTRPGKSPRDKALADLFAKDAEACVLRVLKEAERAMTAVEVKKALLTAGIDKAEVDRAWSLIQKRVKASDHVVVEGVRYRWIDENRTVSAKDALALLVKGELEDQRKAELAAAVRTALEGQPDDLVTAARQRQAEIDAVRVLAELASEVEELVVNETDPTVMIRQVRAWVKRSSLDPIGKAGEETRFDRKLHKAIGSPIRDGAPVIVVRPGYIWKTPDGDVLIGKAVVEE